MGLTQGVLRPKDVCQHSVGLLLQVQRHVHALRYALRHAGQLPAMHEEGNSASSAQYALRHARQMPWSHAGTSTASQHPRAVLCSRACWAAAILSMTPVRALGCFLSSFTASQMGCKDVSQNGRWFLDSTSSYRNTGR